jgi:hypothetical protein
MAQILSRKLSANEARTANKIKLTQMIKEANSILARYNAAGSYPTNSYTNTGDKVTSTSKQVPEKQSDMESRDQYIQRLVNAGYSLAAAQAAAGVRYAPTPATVGGTIRKVQNSSTSITKSVITFPKPGIKQASVPSWVAAATSNNVPNLPNGESSLKSASVQDIQRMEATYESVSEMMSRGVTSH